MPMTLDGVDFSGKFMYRQQGETLRKVYGPYHGRVTLDATEWTDLRGVKHDLAATTAPMSSADLAQLITILEKPSFSMTSYSWQKGELWTRNVIVDGAEAIIGMIRAAGANLIIKNIPIVFREK